MPGEPRKLAAILAADVVGYSRLMAADEAGTLAALKSRRKAVLEPLVAKHQGRVFKIAGDGVLIEFASAVNAVQCAVEVQAAFGAANAALLEDQHIVLRIGVHVGDVMVEGSDLYGDGVNIAARLEAIADPGGICVSAAARDHIGNRVSVGFDDLGPQSLKKMDQQIRVFRVAGAGVSVEPAKPLQTEKSTIAILPFVDMSQSQDQGFLADGIAEDLITELARYDTLSVIARTTTFAFRSRSLSAKDIGRELKADFVIEGSVRLANNRLRVTVQLIDVETGAHSWAERFDRVLEDIFVVQDQIVAAILTRLHFSLSDAVIAQAQRHSKNRVSAHILYLKSEAEWRSGKEELSLQLLHEAIEIDPTHAKALAALAFYYAYGLFSGVLNIDASDAEKLAKQFLDRAIALDPTDFYVLVEAAATFLCLGDPNNAKKCCVAAETQMPLNPQTKILKGTVTAFLGNHHEGLKLVENVIQLEPVVPPGWKVSLHDCRYLCGDHDGALKALEDYLDPPYYMCVLQAANLAKLGRIAESRQVLAKNRPNNFDAVAFAKRCAAMCALESDREHWLDGFRKAGIEA